MGGAHRGADEFFADEDDYGVGRLLSRREALATLGAAGIGMLACNSTPTTPDGATATGEIVAGCVVRPALTEGPYYVDEGLNRSDIRSDPSTGAVKEGALLELVFNVSQISAETCAPLPGAIVDVWHCDALGVYSDATDPGFNTIGQKFLRGYQVTDTAGIAAFTTIYPGWYQGRAVHIHFKIRSGAGAGQAYEFTSQLFFDDALSDQVHSEQPYAAKGQRTLRNSGDGIYNQGGSQLLLAIVSSGSGYAASFDVALQL